MGDTFRFIKGGYEVMYNNYIVSDYIEYKIRNNRTTLDGFPPIEARAVISVHHQRGIDRLYLIMDENGNNSYLLQDRTNKKYNRLN